MQEITDDLEKRKLQVVSFICEDQKGGLVLISYDDDGLVEFISGPVKSMAINERLSGRMVRQIADIGRSDTQRLG